MQRIAARIGMDKVAHFFASAFICLALGKFVHWLIAALVSILLGLVKELLDIKFNWKDIVADILGVVLSVIILLI